ncbi:probable protein ABIL1 [Zingiber officinale]|uniref:probable protein ABIL1 n=1 Tax=Zingiber officinale TaxID=94328 RepID=UPI001C4D73B2|nr:probable protein ABIL1 [Zingiber officinale]
MQPPRSENCPMTFDEVSMERSKSFVKALQELKNLRPQLYTAAEYCESSYLHNEQKQMVLDNLKGYAVRALVNAVDHLGTVASKLTDLFEQQMFDVSIVESGISCLRQRSSTCQAYVDKEGRIQHQMSFRTLRHHKHYTLPSLDKTAISSMQMPPKSDVTAKPSSGTSGKSSSKTLSWHLATSGGTSSALPCLGDPRTSKIKAELFHLLVPEEAAASLSSPSTNHLLAANGNATSDIASNKFGLAGSKEASKPVPAIKSLHGHGALQIYRPRTRSRSMLSVFFSKPKTLTSRNISVS